MGVGCAGTTRAVQQSGAGIDRAGSDRVSDNDPPKSRWGKLHLNERLRRGFRIVAMGLALSMIPLSGCTLRRASADGTSFFKFDLLNLEVGRNVSADIVKEHL